MRFPPPLNPFVFFNIDHTPIFAISYNYPKEYYLKQNAKNCQLFLSWQFLYYFTVKRSLKPCINPAERRHTTIMVCCVPISADAYSPMAPNPITRRGRLLQSLSLKWRWTLFSVSSINSIKLPSGSWSQAHFELQQATKATSRGSVFASAPSGPL